MRKAGALARRLPHLTPVPAAHSDPDQMLTPSISRPRSSGSAKHIANPAPLVFRLTTSQGLGVGISATVSDCHPRFD
jgi:hypothetical protein